MDEGGTFPTNAAAVLLIITCNAGLSLIILASNGSMPMSGLVNVAAVDGINGTVRSYGSFARINVFESIAAEGRKAKSGKLGHDPVWRVVGNSGSATLATKTFAP